jgi:hypothetical protein
MVDAQHNIVCDEARVCSECRSVIAQEKLCPFCNSYQSGPLRYLNRALFGVLLLFIVSATVQCERTLTGLSAGRVADIERSAGELKTSLESLAVSAESLQRSAKYIEGRFAQGTASRLDLLVSRANALSGLKPLVATQEELNSLSKDSDRWRVPVHRLLFDLAAVRARELHGRWILGVAEPVLGYESLDAARRSIREKLNNSTGENQETGSEKE